MHVSSLPLHILCVDSLAQLDVDGEILTSAKEIANASVVRSSNVISGKSLEESPPKFRRKLPVPRPKWAGQVSPCNDVSQSFGEADVKVMPPAAEPWDKLRGDQFDVMENEVALDEVISNSAAQHHGPNCGTFSRARERPIPGVVNSPKPLRSNEFPEGLPYLEQPRWNRMKVRVDRDSYMAIGAAQRCIRAHKAGLPFTLEHPGNSIARELSSWKELVAMEGVFIVEHHHCMFQPCLKRKFQILITNIESLSTSLGRVCKDVRVCSRTKAPHSAFAHEVKDGRVVKFGTAGTSEYPRELREIRGKVIVDEVMSRGLLHFKFSFVEVFSGPKAPLTEAVKGWRGIGSPIPASKRRLWGREAPPQSWCLAPRTGSHELHGIVPPPKRGNRR